MLVQGYLAEHGIKDFISRREKRSKAILGDAVTDAMASLDMAESFGEVRGRLGELSEQRYLANFLL